MNIEDFKSGLTKFVQMFTDAYGLKLVFRGTACYTDGKTVVIPELALLARPNMTEKEIEEAQSFLMTTRGFVYHEGAHVIFSDFATCGVAHKEGGRKLHTICNVLEDIRIEKRISALYPGAKEALIHMRAWLNEQLVDVVTKEAPSPFVQAVYAIGLLGDNVNTYQQESLWKALEAPARSLAERHKKNIIKARDANTTQEVLQIAKKIFEELREEQKQYEKKQKEKKKQEKQKEKADSNPPLEDGDDVECEDGDGAGSPDGKDDVSENESSAGGSHDANEAESEDETDSKGSGSSKSTKDRIRSDRSKDLKTSSSADDASRNDEDVDDEAKKSVVGASTDTEDEHKDLDLDDFNKKEEYKRCEDIIQEAAKKAGKKLVSSSHRPYLIYSTEDDFIGSPDDRHDAVEARRYLNELTEKVRFAFGPMERTLRARLQAQSHAYHVGGLEDGELDQAALDRLATRVDERVFRERVVASTLTDTACGITIDMSGSMKEQRKYLLAQQAVLCFAHALETVRVPFEVLSWSTGNPYQASDRYYRSSQEEKELYTRWGSLLLYILKSYNEKWSQVATRIRHLEPKITNYDGESLKFSAQRLLQRKEKRKVLFVLSDGLPGFHEGERPDRMVGYLSDVIREIRATKKIELIGIGVNSPNSKVFYEPSFVNVAVVEDLPNVVIQQLKSLLLKKAK